MANEKPLQERCKICKVIFALCLATSIGLVLAGFLVPLTGKIDGSVLTAVGELFAFAALAVGAHANGNGGFFSSFSTVYVSFGVRPLSLLTLR